jgi:hypothetical protein
MQDEEPKSEHISDVRSMLLDQLRALRAVPVAGLAEEIRRAKSVSEVAQTIVNTARVEVDYIQAVRGASDSSFLQAPDEATVPKLPASPQSPLPAPEGVARVGGPAENHPWRATAHKLGR